MAAESGPDIITDGLVLALDGANIRSFRGGPTTNILPNAAANGRFTTSNGWGTYNVNQYNSNTYFNIGTISSVSNNIVTTTSNHRFRTFDVVRAQTTGGGITAGTNYFIKKISNTSFSIHQYNSSQNGSQGYINPSTGFHKVHDSIANDERISINSTNFPTMWWGPPHLPNAGLVKEIVQDGGYISGTNCMRLHIPRTSGIDGMAYGVYSPVTQGDSITVSYWAKTNAVGAAGNATLGFSTYFGPGQSAYSRYTDVLTEDWKLITHNWTASNTFSFYQYFWPSGESTPYWIDIADLMVETGPAPTTTRFFTTGTRGATVATGGGWADLSGNSNHGELVNGPTYNSGNFGSLVFDGSNDGIQLSGTNFSLNQMTISSWNFSSNYQQEGFMFEKTTNGSVNTQYSLFFNSVNNLYYRTYGLSTRDLIVNRTTAGVVNNQWNNVVATFDGTNKRIYVNGILRTTSGNLTGTVTQNSTGAAYIGIYGNFGGYPFDGKISQTQIYNRALSAEEVLQNYNATKGRFGL